MRVSIILILTFLLSFSPKTARTQEEKKNIRIIQQKSFMRDGRIELTPSFGLSLNENLNSHFFTGGSISYHITDLISLGGDYFKYFGKMSSLAKEVGNDFFVYPEKKLIQQYFGAHFSYVLIYGKFVSFERFIIHFDAYVKGGGGVIETSYKSYHPSGNIGIGLRIFLTDFLTFNLELTDYIYRENYRAENLMINNVSFCGSFSVFAPFKYEYKYPK